jgi:hypothetical protein
VLFKIKIFNGIFIFNRLYNFTIKCFKNLEKTSLTICKSNKNSQKNSIYTGCIRKAKKLLQKIGTLYTLISVASSCQWQAKDTAYQETRGRLVLMWSVTTTGRVKRRPVLPDLTSTSIDRWVYQRVGTDRVTVGIDSLEGWSDILLINRFGRYLSSLATWHIIIGSCVCYIS